MERKFTKTDQIERDEAEKFISLFKRQAVRLDRLVNDMLDVSRIHRGKFELKCDVYEMYEFLEKVIESFKESFEEHGQTINFSGDCPIYVNFDEIRMEQVIGNILTNALKYAPESPVTIELKKSSTHIRTEIKDNGPGIEKSKLDKIFTRFERASSHSEVSGLGLGLYISKEIIKAHKGKIWAESGPGKGATFIIELPLSR